MAVQVPITPHGDIVDAFRALANVAMYASFAIFTFFVYSPCARFVTATQGYA
jgi:hypothetical protein